MHIVLRQYHVMAGCDYHNEVTATPPPVPAPMIPHVVGHVMQGWGITATALMTDDKVKALGTKIMQRDTDIGNGIIHVPIPPYPPCALLPLIIPTSGSKSYFGPATVLAQGKPIAGAVLIVVNPNLNCADPCAMPLNVVVAWGNVVCGMTIGDILGGILAMGIDAAITFGFNKLGGWAGGKLFGKITNVFFNKMAEGLLSQAIQQLTGSPLGYTNAPLHYLLGDNASVGNWGAALGHAAGSKIDELLGDAPPAATSQMLASPPGTPPAGTPATNGIVNDPGVEEL
ncbi:MAG: hypothetical protein LAO51_07000 [Acidobacteriia bacterium]|nr:hypothetical protein [Terriglobia bacterium]